MFDLFAGPRALQNELRYNYSEIDPEHRETVREAALDIRQRSKRASDDILAIGTKLCEVKELLPHGQFQDWVSEEFELSHRTAQNLMNVALRFGDKSETVSLLGASALYLLAAPSTPPAAIDAVVEHAKANGAPTKVETQRIIAEHRATRTATVRETEAVVWRAVSHNGRRNAADQLAWMATATADDYAAAVNPGIVLDPNLLTGCIGKVRAELQRMAEREAVKAPQVVRGKVVTWSPPPPTEEVDDEDPADGAVEVFNYSTEEEAIDGEIVPVEPPPDIVTDEKLQLNRTQRLRYLLTAMKEAMRLVPEYSTLTGCHVHGGKLKRELELAIHNLEENLV